MTRGKGGGKGKAHFMPGRSRKRANIRRQKAKFPKLVKEIIGISDILLEVLDARFISETRNREFEKEVINQGKELVYVLNKSDLVDVDSKMREVSLLELSPVIFVSSKNRIGVAKLRSKIKMMVKKVDLGDKKRAQVGVIGYPNTGKSSLINVLTGRPSAKTGAAAGFTKGMQKLKLSSNILILDTPGVIPMEEYSHVRRSAIQKQVVVGARDASKVHDPESVVAGLVRVYQEQIEGFYEIDAGGDSEVLIEKLGKRRKLLKKGGLVDVDRTARIILTDWQSGKIRIG
tara:strand:- start:165 stop:1028 length:864 start_codon:yes stop_codon:yes gene_type:complete